MCQSPPWPRQPDVDPRQAPDNRPDIGFVTILRYPRVLDTFRKVDLMRSRGAYAALGRLSKQKSRNGRWIYRMLSARDPPVGPVDPKCPVHKQSVVQKSSALSSKSGMSGLSHSGCANPRRRGPIGNCNCQRMERLPHFSSKRLLDAGEMVDARGV